MTNLFLQPADVLLFRDGRRFSAGDDHLATGLFPPLPTTFYGALRTAVFTAHGADFSNSSDFGVSEAVADVAGSKEQVGTLRIGAFALARRTNGVLTRYRPVPRDVLVRKGDEDKEPENRTYRLMKPLAGAPPGGARTNLPPGVSLLWAQQEAKAFYKNASGYLPEAAFRRLLGGELEAMQHVVESKTLFQPEPRTSVQIAPDTYASSEGRLFTVEFTRMAAGAGFALAVEDGGLLPEAGGELRLGGEARPAHYEAVQHDAADRAARIGELKNTLKEKVRRTGRFKAVLVTPAPFENGWRPDDLEADGTGVLGGCRVRLEAAAVGRYRHLGGWDIAERRPKPTRRAAPAGSVYFFEIEDAAGQSDIDALFEKLHGGSLCARDEDRKQGLGLAALGTYTLAN